MGQYNNNKQYLTLDPHSGSSNYELFGPSINDDYESAKQVKAINESDYNIVLQNKILNKKDSSSFAAGRNMSKVRLSINQIGGSYSSSNSVIEK